MRWEDIIILNATVVVVDLGHQMVLHKLGFLCKAVRTRQMNWHWQNAPSHWFCRWLLEGQ